MRPVTGAVLAIAIAAASAAGGALLLTRALEHRAEAQADAQLAVTLRVDAARLHTALALARATAESVARDRSVQEALALGGPRLVPLSRRFPAAMFFDARGTLVAGRPRPWRLSAAAVVSRGGAVIGRVRIPVRADAVSTTVAPARERLVDARDPADAVPTRGFRVVRAAIGGPYSLVVSTPEAAVAASTRTARLLVILAAAGAFLSATLLATHRALGGPPAAGSAAAARVLGEALEATHDLRALVGVVLRVTTAATGAVGGRVLEDRTVLLWVGAIDPEPSLAIAIPSTEAGPRLVLELSAPPGGFSRGAAAQARRLAERAAVAIDNMRRHTAAQERAASDDLTGLANRRTFLERLEQELGRSKRITAPIAVVAADIDGFKGINDAFGHATGDIALQRFAEVIGTHVRTIDTVARLGGDEFAILLPQSDSGGAATLAERIRVASAELQILSQHGWPLRLTASFGVAAVAGPGLGAAELLAAADEALYRAKEAGRNRVVVNARPERVS